MAKSLDQLIDFLLEEVALSGERGLTAREIVDAVTQFYNHNERSDTLETADTTEVASTTIQTTAEADRPFLEKIWRWLGRHEDVSIGKNHAYDQTPLADLERDFPGLLATALYRSNLEDHAKSHDPPVEVPPPSQPEYETGLPITTARTGKTHSAPRIYVTKTRMSIAICGHPPDSTRVFPLEWQLLSHIAAARHGGVLQGDLVRLSGQDKRSVPKRTDALQAKGYIVKQMAYVKGNKTSRLVLHRYVASPSKPVAESSENLIYRNEVLTVRHKCLQLFEKMSKLGQLIPKDDLASALGVKSTDHQLVFDQIIRHFIRAGCLKRTKAAFGPSAQSSDLKVCIQWIRNPEDADWLTLSDNDYIDFDRVLQEDFEEQNMAATRFTFVNGIHQTEADNDSEEVTVASFRQIPQWSPDRVLANVLFQAALEFGKRGLSNIEARKTTTGLFVRRVLESLLMKSSHYSLQSQPVGLKHLSIVRSKQVINGTVVFLHYAFRSFAELVYDGQRTWADAEGGEQFLKSMTTNTRADFSGMDVVVERDSFGFPTSEKPPLQIQDGVMSLTDIARKYRADDFSLTVGEPVLDHDSSGQLHLVPYQSHSAEPSKSRSSAKTARQLKSSTDKPARGSKRSQMNKNDDDVMKGRPRKFMRGTEKFWRDMFLLAKQEEDPAFTKSSAAGLMSDPVGLRVFQSRPSDFDETLVEAISARLPIPRKPSEITRHWIDTTLTILDPPSPGLYFSSIGHVDNRRSTQSKLMLVKLPRIQKIDFTNRKKIWDWQHISSSASHSYRYQRYYPKLGNTPNRITKLLRYQRAEQGQSSAPDQPEKQAQTSAENPKLDANDNITNQLGPPRGIFYEDTNASARKMESLIPSTSMAHNSANIVMVEDSDTTESDPDLPRPGTRHITTNSHSASETPHRHVNPPLRVSPASPGSTIDDSIDVYRVWLGASVPAHARPSRTIRPTRKLAEVRHADNSTLNSSRTLGERRENFLEVGQQQSVNASEFRRGNQSPVRLSENQQVSTMQDDKAINAGASANSNIQLIDPEPSAIHTINTQSLLQNNGIAASEQPSPEHNPLTYTQSVVETTPLSLQSKQDNEQHVISTTPHPPELHVHADTSAPLLKEPETTTISTQDESAAEELALHQGSHDPKSVPQADSLSGQKQTHPRKRSRAEVDDQAEDSDHARHNRRKKQGEATRPQITKICRRILLELLELCSGIAPCEPYTFRRAMGPKWQESGIRSEPPTARIVRTSLNSLCQGVKYKRLTFAFKTKAGAMDQKQIIASTNFNLESPEVVKIQTKMIEAEPTDYVPPELAAEGRRTALEIRPPQADDDEAFSQSESDVVIPPTRRKVVGQRRKSQRKVDATPQREDSPSASPEPPSLNTGFLTLKIANLHTLNLPTSYALSYNPQEAEPVDRRKLSARNRRAHHVDDHSGSEPPVTPRRRNITWKKSRMHILPDSIDDIPNIDLCRDEVAMTHTSDPTYALFAAEIDCVAAWESKSAAVFDQSGDKLRFINHHVNHQTPDLVVLPPSVEFKAMVDFDLDGHEVEAEIPEPRSWTPFRIAMERTQASPSPPISVTSTPNVRFKRKYRKRARQENTDTEPKRKKRKFGRKPRSTQRRGSQSKLGDNSSAQNKRKRAQLVRYVPQEVRYRVIVSVVVIRTLTGGIEKYINWSLVSRLFPDRDEDFLQSLWKSLHFKYRADVNGLTDSLHEKYLEALADGKVPTVNFDNLSTTDWEGIFDWALTNLDKFIVNKIDDLPDTRKTFDQTSTCILHETVGMRDILGYGGNVTQPRKEEIYSGVVFGTSATDLYSHEIAAPAIDEPAEPEIEDVALSRAKSWIMAVVLTSAANFRPLEIHAKLHKLGATPEICEQVMVQAIKVLQRDKVISRISNAGKNASSILEDKQVLGVRVWEASSKFFETFNYRRQVTTKMLRTAAKYKTETLDALFVTGQAMTLVRDCFLEDGEMIAILNLLGMGMIKIRPGLDKPDTRYGLDWERKGYITKLLDKKVLGFSVIVEFVPDVYVSGDIYHDVRQNLRIPRGEIDDSDGRGRIPLWFDINHLLLTEVWEMVLGAVVGLISIRPGIDDKELSKSLNGAINQWEMEMITDYLKNLGAIKKTRSGQAWETQEWWWMTIGSSEMTHGQQQAEDGHTNGDDSIETVDEMTTTGH